MTSYFERNGAIPCKADENPAEWMLRAIGAAPGAHTDIDWTETWKKSPEFGVLQDELKVMMKPSASQSETQPVQTSYAAPSSQQFLACTMRSAEQYWRTPTYIYAKMILCLGTVRWVLLNSVLFLTTFRVSSSAFLFKTLLCHYRAFKTRCSRPSCSLSLSLSSSTRQCRDSSPNDHFMRVERDLQRPTLGTTSSSPTSLLRWCGTRLHLSLCTSPFTSLSACTRMETSLILRMSVAV